jgi:hypothetical protein
MPIDKSAFNTTPCESGGESLFLRKIFPSFLLGKISKNLIDRQVFKAGHTECMPTLQQ